MVSNRLALVILGASVVAAASGGYLASRPSPAGAPAVPEATAAPAAPVEETEAVLNDIEISKPLAPVSKPREIPQRSAAPARSESPKPAAAPRAASPAGTASSRSVDIPRPSPSATAPAPSPTPEPVQSVASAVEVATPTTRDEEVRAPEVARAPEPPARTFEELVVSADSVLGLQMETAVSSERARVEDRVEARVVRDVKVGGAVAIPAGSRAIGSVMVVERGGKLKERARLGIRFHTLVLADGTRLPLTTDTVYRNGDAPSNSSAAKIGGGAAAGAILGAILGGAKGAAIGGTVGAGAGTAAVMSGDRNAATFPAGTEVTARIIAPVTVTIEK